MSAQPIPLPTPTPSPREIVRDELDRSTTADPSAVVDAIPRPWTSGDPGRTWRRRHRDPDEQEAVMAEEHASSDISAPSRHPRERVSHPLIVAGG